MNADTPVPEFVTEAFDDDGRVVGQCPGCLGLFAEVVDDVRGGKRVEEVFRGENAERIVDGHRADTALEFTNRPTKLDRAAEKVPVPEGHLCRLTGCRAHDHFLECDVLDAPCRRAEQERLTGPRFVDHLFVEFADAGAVGKKDTVETTVRDGATVGDGETLRTVTRTQAVGDAVPHDARPQFVELVARVTTGEQVEHVVEDLVGHLGKVRAPSHDDRQFVDGCLAGNRHVGNDLLGEDIERIAQVARGLDGTVDHTTGNDRRFDEVPTVFRKQPPPTGLAHAVARTADTLQTPADRAG